MGTRNMMGLRAVLMGTCLAVGGCAIGGGELADEATASSGGTADFESYFLEQTGVALEDAQDELGVSDDTYGVYLEVADRDFVLASDVQSVMPEFIDCIGSTTIGLQVEYDPDLEGVFGLPSIGWAIITPPGRTTTAAEDAFIEDCWHRTIGPLENLFFNQPYSPERNDAWLAEGRRDTSWACLEAAGYFVSEDGSFQDTLDLAKRMSDETHDSTCLELVLYGKGE